MAMPIKATFDYFSVVPFTPETASVSFLKTRDRAGEEVHRLVGPCPDLQIVDGLVVLRSLRRSLASVYVAIMRIDPDLVRVFRYRDVFHLARNCGGRVGLSLLRDGKLVFAIGQVSAVPLGDGVELRYQREPGKDTSSDLQQLLAPCRDLRLEISVFGDSRQLQAGQRISVGEYDVSLLGGRHEFLGPVECGAMSLATSSGLHEAAIRSAKMLDQPGGWLTFDWPQDERAADDSAGCLSAILPNRGDCSGSS